MTIHPATSSSDGGGSSSSFDAPQCSAHFFVRATDSKTIAVHAAWDDTVGALLAHLADCGYGRDLRLLYKGRQLLPEATSASLCLPPDSTLHLAARLRSTPHPEAWQLASHIAATAAAATPTPTPSHSLDGLVKEYILLASFTRRRSDRSAPVDTQSTEHCAAEYLDIFLQAGAAVALVRRWMPYGPMHKNLYNMEHQHGDTWVWELHEMSMNLLRRVEECLKRLEMDLSTLSSESWRVIESQPLWSNRLHILAMLTELDSISALFEDLAHNLRVMLLAHKAPLNALVRCSKRNEHLHWLVKHKDLLCFEARRNLVLMLFSEGKDDYGELHEMLIDRSYFLDEFFEYITHAKLSVLHSGLFVEFKNEETTGPGVLREWLRMVCQALFSPQQVLFSPCRNDQRRFYWNGSMYKVSPPDKGG
ncbi:E3 ubiquitin-protein ligase UPL5 [Brachypodium distachyon]|uniref:E3 ubiquitin-protein ligase UPL5 n=1 Tax=Brachypodium distachyon TaxID=15368 RepID=UPI000D0D471D|nr:E3 ubiquitin-protein ligase UPL5 [Brachypodium distachyon]|eukprot:XP_024310499.1 E3 ubiquitin-protein ligase UPL5 [Brachypodium distachyon]